MKFIKHFTVTLIISCIAYGIGDEYGKYMINQYAHSGGLVLAKDMISLKYCGEWFCIAVWGVSIWIFSLYFDK